MAISFAKYITITSGVGGGAAVAERQLIGRLFTTSALVSPNAVLEFPDETEVGNFFGTSSVEYARAVFYKKWISPSIVQAGAIQFARYNSTAIAPIIYGGPLASTLAQLQAIVAGVLSISTPTGTAAIVAINLSTAVSLAGAAALLQTKVRASGNASLALATVAYDVANGRFVITGGLTGAVQVLGIVAAGAGNTDVATLCALNTAAGAFVTVGADAQTPVSAVTAMNNISNNYGSFLFMSALTLPDIVLVASYNDALNVQFQYCVGVLAADTVALSAALANTGGVSATLIDAAYPNEYDEMVPMIQLAATDYSRRNGVTNYMYKVFSLTPKVTDDPTATALDALRINYYGVTQINGQFVTFYQDGVLFGSSSSPIDMNVYGNEQWFKNYVAVQFIKALLALQIIPANDEGEGICKTILQSGIDRGLYNGTISVSKTLTTEQKLYITQQTGDENAWYQVQNIGYWYNVVLVPTVQPGGNVIYKAVYLLIYSKSDAIRKIEGTHILV